MMSGMLSKTLQYLSRVGGEGGPGWSVPSPQHRHSLPPGLAAWLHQLTSCLDKDQERQLVTRQLEAVRERLSQRTVSPGVCSDCMVRLLYIYLLGYDVSPVLAHCVKLAGADNILARKMGYLASSLMIPPSDKLLLLLTNSIVRDISSNNIVDIQLGLVAAANIANPALLELVPMLVERARSLLRHSSHLIRSKSLVLLDRLCQLEPGHWPEVCPDVIHCLGDGNPGVVIFTVQLLSHHLTDSDGDNAKLVVSAVVQLQLSLAEDNKFPSDYKYKGHTVPHLQVYCVTLYRRVPSILSTNQQLADSVLSLLQSCLTSNLGSKELIIQALIYEVTVTVCSIDSAHCLLPLCLRSMGSFVSSRHSSTIYSGLCGLETIFRVRSPGTSRDQEKAVLSCLAHPDTNIQRRAAQLSLLLVRRENLVSIVDRVMAHVSRSKSRADCSVLMDRVVVILEKYADTVDCDWKASTLLRIIQLSKHRQRDLMIERLKFLLSSSSSDEGDAATVLELNSVRLKFRSLLGDIVKARLAAGRAVPPAVTSLEVWCEAQFSEDVRAGVDRIVATARENREQVLVVTHCIAGLQSLAMRHGLSVLGGGAVECVEENLCHPDRRVQQAALQCLTVITDCQSSDQLGPGQPLQLDFSLSFLDSHVIQSLSSGTATFTPRPSSQDPTPQLITSAYSIPLSEERPASDEPRTPVTRSVWTDQGRLDIETETEEVTFDISESQMVINNSSLDNVDNLDDDWD